MLCINKRLYGADRAHRTHGTHGSDRADGTCGAHGTGIGIARNWLCTNGPDGCAFAASVSRRDLYGNDVPAQEIRKIAFKHR